MNILVSGLLNVETTVSVRGFPINYYPIDYPFFGINSNVSGVGFNIAKALTILGDNVDLFSFLGKDYEAARILQQLDNDNIRTENIHQCLKNTPVSTVLFDPEGRRQIYCDLKDIQEQMINPDESGLISERYDLAVLCNINFNRRLIAAARQKGKLTATDVHVLSDVHDEYNRDFMSNADILFLSDEKIPGKPEEFIKELYHCYHNSIIVIGMGAKGAMLHDAEKGEAVVIPAYSTGKIVNTIGAGDALFSAFLHFYTKDSDAESALRKAVVFAGIKIGYNGASVGFCKENDIESVINQKS